MTIVNLECSSFFTMRKFDCNWPTFWFTGLWQVNFQELSKTKPCPPFANTYSPLIQNGEFCIACWNWAIFLCFFGIRSIIISDCINEILSFKSRAPRSNFWQNNVMWLFHISRARNGYCIIRWLLIVIVFEFNLFVKQITENLKYWSFATVTPFTMVIWNIISKNIPNHKSENIMSCAWFSRRK